MLDIHKKSSQSEVRQISKGSLFLRTCYGAFYISKPIAQNQTSVFQEKNCGQ